MQDSRQDVLLFQVKHRIKLRTFDSAEDFVQAMLESTAPTMLMYGGSYLKEHEITVERAFLFNFHLAVVVQM